MIKFISVFFIFYAITIDFTVNKEITRASRVKYEFRKHPIPPRIYAQAPSTVQVTKVVLAVEPQNNLNGSVTRRPTKAMENDKQKALVGLDKSTEPANTTECFPKYWILPDDQTDDHERFTIDQCSGLVSTAKYVHKPPGQFYHIAIAAFDLNNVTLSTIKLDVEVTTYNSDPPAFQHQHYSKEVLDNSAIGSPVLTLRASDNDSNPHNRQLFYALQDIDHKEDPWLFPLARPVSVNTTTGEVIVSNSLLNITNPLQFLVIVSDGGSPQRSGIAKMTLHVRNMTAPRNVRIVNITESSARICWSPPLHGVPEGYMISYSARGPSLHDSKDHRGTKNITNDQLEKRTEPVSLDIISGISGNSPEFMDIGSSQGFPKELYDFFSHQFCTRVGGLAPITNYAFSVRGWADNGKISMARMPLTIITRRRNCYNSTCIHGVCQELIAPPGFKCLCTPGYTSVHCEKRDPCYENGVNLCQNGGTCLPQPDSESDAVVTCVCVAGYSGRFCQYNNPCEAPFQPCLNNGVCIFKSNGTYTCVCGPEYTGQDCNKRTSHKPPQFCKEEETHLPQGSYLWPSTPVGETRLLACQFGQKTLQRKNTFPNFEVELSPLNKLGRFYNYKVNTSESPESFAVENSSKTKSISQHQRVLRNDENHDSDELGAVRKCIANPSSGLPIWSTPNVDRCKTEDEEADQLLKMTSDAKNVKQDTLKSSVKKVTKLVDSAIKNTKVARKMVSVLSNILEVDRGMFDPTSNNVSTETSDTILSTLEKFTAKVSLTPERGKNIVKLREKNLVVEAKLFRKEDLPSEVSFTPEFIEPDDQKSEGNDISTAGDVVSTKAHNLWIRVPKHSLKKTQSEELRFQFLSFKDGRAFQSKLTSQELLDRPVVSASVHGVPMSKLDSPITYMIPLDPFDPFLELPSCAYWDQKTHVWSSEGIETRQNENGEVFCESTHLTAFSVLMDPIGSPIMKQVMPFLSVITYIGLTLSTLALVATVLTFALFKKMNRDRSGLIVMNLGLALLTLNLAFLGADFIGSHRGACIIFGALLHYAVAASFAWMLIEALNMYQMLVTVFPSSETYFIRKRICVGWGFPLLLIITALIWDKRVYFTEYQTLCVISSLIAPAIYYTTYLGPVCIVLSINLFVFLRVLRVLCQSRPSYKRRIPISVAQIRGAIAIVALLGITWMAGVFAVGHFRVVAQFLFCLTTPFQGLIIFWVRVVQNTEARTAWKIFLKTGSTRLRPKPVSSVRTNSSHQSSSIITHTSSSTPPRSFFSGALKAVRRLSTISNSGFGFMSSANAKRRKGSTAIDNKNRSSTTNKQLNEKDECPNDSSLYSNVGGFTNTSNSNSNAPESKEVVKGFSKPDDTDGFPRFSKIEIDEEPLKELHHILSNYTFFEDRANKYPDGTEMKNCENQNVSKNDLGFSEMMKEEEERLLQQFVLGKTYGKERENTSSGGQGNFLSHNSTNKISSSPDFVPNTIEIETHNTAYGKTDEFFNGDLTEPFQMIKSLMHKKIPSETTRMNGSDKSLYYYQENSSIQNSKGTISQCEKKIKNGKANDIEVTLTKTSSQNLLTPNGHFAPSSRMYPYQRASSEQNISLDSESATFVSRKSASNVDIGKLDNETEIDKS